MKHIDYLRRWGPQPAFDEVFACQPGAPEAGPQKRPSTRDEGSDSGRFPKSEPGAYLGKQPSYERFLSEIDDSAYCVLDVGCGVGKYRNEIKRRAQYVGMDFDSALQPEVVCDFNREPFPFPDESFDFVLSDSVLEHLMRPFDVMDEVYRVLKKGGRGFILVPFHYKAHGSPYDFFRYSKGGLHLLLRKFADIEIYPIGGSISVLCHILWNYGRLFDRIHLVAGNIHRCLVWSVFKVLNPLDRFDPYRVFTRGHYAFFCK